MRQRERKKAERTANAVWEAWRSGARLAELPLELRPTDIEQGMACQAELERLAGPRAGWKVAATSAAGQARIGVPHPLAGRVFEQFVKTSGATLPAQHLHMAIVEAEFVFRFGKGIAPFDNIELDRLLAAVDSMHLAIEVPESRLVNFGLADAAEVLADNACGAYLVVGPEVPSWAGLDLATQTVSISVDGVVTETGSGANVLGDPREALLWLARELARFNIPIEAGDIVATGSLTTPPPIHPSAQIVADFHGLGEVKVSFSPTLDPL